MSSEKKQPKKIKTTEIRFKELEKFGLHPQTGFLFHLPSDVGFGKDTFKNIHIVSGLAFASRRYVINLKSALKWVPAFIAKDFVDNSKKLGLPPHIGYVHYILANVKLPDTMPEILNATNVDNVLNSLKVLRTFNGHKEEKAFIKIHAVIEWYASLAAKTICELIDLTIDNSGEPVSPTEKNVPSDAKICALFKDVKQCVENMDCCIHKMKLVNPREYFIGKTSFRHFVGGSKSMGGVVMLGTGVVSNYDGASGAQSISFELLESFLLGSRDRLANKQNSPNAERDTKIKKFHDANAMFHLPAFRKLIKYISDNSQAVHKSMENLGLASTLKDVAESFVLLHNSHKGMVESYIGKHGAGTGGGGSSMLQKIHEELEECFNDVYVKVPNVFQKETSAAQLRQLQNIHPSE